MLRTLRSKKAILATLAVGTLSACGIDPYGVQYDQYGNPISPYGSSAYGSAYGSTYDSSSSYSSSYGSSYDSSSYSSSYGSSYSSYDSSYGSTYGSSPVPSAAPTLPPVVIASEASVLNAYVKDVKKNGILGLGGITASVECTNPTNRTLTGKLTVSFTASGHLSGNQQTRKITLRPLETQLLTFTASGITLNGAEASIDTDTVTGSQSTVSDRTP